MTSRKHARLVGLRAIVSTCVGIIVAGTQADESLTWAPLNTRSKSVDTASGPLFERLPTSRTGIDLVVPIDTRHPLKRVYSGGFSCGGVAIGDVDGDRRPDLYLVNGPGGNRLYRQSSDFRFDDITQRAGVDGGNAWGVGAAMVDIDDDGDLDLYVCNYDAANQLFRNDGQGHFVECAAQLQLDIRDSSLFAAFCDFDRDGDLDAYLLTNRLYQEGGFPTDLKLVATNGQVSLPEELRAYYAIQPSGRYRGKLSMVGRPDRLLRNDGERFVDVTGAAGMSIVPDHGLAATWWDYDNDGWPDLYVSNDFNDPDHLYHNNRDGTFHDVTEQQLPHTAWFSMGSDTGDVNNDGLIDLFVADMSATTHFDQKTTMGAMGKNASFLENTRPPQYMRNTLFLNTGVARFLEIAYLAGVDSTDWTWSSKFADLDNDGWVDLYITNGMTRNLNDSDLPFTLADQMGGTKWDLYENLPPLRQQNLAFHNRGDLRFEDVSRAWGLDHVGMSFASAVADLDRDGDLDIVVANLDEPPSVYRNHSVNGNGVLIELQATRGARSAIGATVHLESAAGSQVRQLFPHSGYLASHEAIVHFGLGEDQQIRRLTIDWPSGFRQVVDDLPANRHYQIRESSMQMTPAPTPVAPMFRVSPRLPHIQHTEIHFDDFARQPLLPNRLSQLGPGVAIGDVDNDGDDDLYLGGAGGQSGTLLTNRGTAGFGVGPRYPFAVDSSREDLGVLLFDADGDGDQDLFVAGGGVECSPDDTELADQLYLNQGAGNFLPPPAGTMPATLTSDSTVSACDFDRDGDLDLFVGGRVIPGEYPLAPPSRLLRNDDGRFVDVTSELAEPLLRSGMVTSAVWSDADNDGWNDLLVTHDWGPVKLFRNDAGKLIDMTREAGLAERVGWWNGIAARDLDGDEDIDYVVTNFGLNTKYHASSEHPALIYYGDFDGSGRRQIVEAEYEHDTLFPVRGRSCSTNAMPMLREKFDSYKSFALADLGAIYTPQKLAQSLRLAATTLESGTLINDGQGHFEFRPLATLAQCSPGFGVVLTELDGDGNCDLYIVQNFFQPQIETGRMDGGVSLLLRGQGDGTFVPVSPRDSGLVVPGDAKSVAVIDSDNNGWPDLFVGINDGEYLLFEHQTTKYQRPLCVRLVGPRGNPTAIGARLTVQLDDNSRQTAEIQAGGGYLSQSTATLVFGLGRDRRVKSVSVRWPDGRRSQHDVTDHRKTVSINYSETGSR